MANAAGGWIRDCWKVGLLMLMMLGVGFGIAGKSEGPLLKGIACGLHVCLCVCVWILNIMATGKTSS